MNESAIDPEIFEYKGYRIPVPLVNLTGGGTDTWDEIASAHMEAYTRYAPIDPDASVLEIGCGVGRDAMQLTEHLSPGGRYIGIDIIRPSIAWCQANITPRHPNFLFHHLDIQSQIHNPGGSRRLTDVTLPVASRVIDRVILQSVFTHMFYDDIVHYLREFRRVLSRGGVVFASFFITDEESLRMARENGDPSPGLRFEHPYGKGCFINDPAYPEGAVGYTPEKLDEIVRVSGVVLDQPVHRGHWCGRAGVRDGQDVVVLRVAHARERSWLRHIFG